MLKPRHGAPYGEAKTGEQWKEGKQKAFQSPAAPWQLWDSQGAANTRWGTEAFYSEGDGGEMECKEQPAYLTLKGMSVSSEAFEIRASIMVLRHQKAA